MKGKFGVLLVIFLLAALLSCGAAAAESAFAAEAVRGEQAVVKLAETDRASGSPEFVNWMNGPASAESYFMGTKVTLRWSPDPSLRQTGYAIFVMTRRSYMPDQLPLGWYIRKGGKYYIPIATMKKTDLSTLKYTFDAGKDGTVYYTIFSYYKNPKKTLSKKCILITLNINDKVGKPTGLKVEQKSDTKVKLTWKTANNAQKYEIYRANKKGFFKKLDTVKGKLNYYDNTIKSGKIYRYKVVAVNGSRSKESKIVTAYPYKKKMGLKAEYRDGKLTLRWQHNKKIKQYLIMQKGPGDSRFYQIMTVKAPASEAEIIPGKGDGTYAFYLIPETGDFTGQTSERVSLDIQIINYRALLIGQSYPDRPEEEQLPACLKDMNAFRYMLENLNTRYSEIVCRSNENYAQILAHIDEVFSEAGPNDVTVLYYSGHGGQGGSLVATDAYLSPSKLRETLDQYQGKKVLIIDACHSGGMIRKSAGALRAEMASFSSTFIRAFRSQSTRGEYDLAEDGYYVMTACRGSELSWTSGSLYSYFTRAFLRGCGWNEETSASQGMEADGNGDNRVTFQEAYSFVQSKMNNYAIVYHDDNNNVFTAYQHTQVWPLNCAEVFFAR